MSRFRLGRWSFKSALTHLGSGGLRLYWDVRMRLITYRNGNRNGPFRNWQLKLRVEKCGSVGRLIGQLGLMSPLLSHFGWGSKVTAIVIAALILAQVTSLGMTLDL